MSTQYLQKMQEQWIKRMNERMQSSETFDLVEDVCEWWFKEFSTYTQEIVDKIQGLKVSLPTTIASLDMRREELRLAWNQACEEAIKILQQ